MAWEKLVPVGPQGEKGEPGTGTVASVNNIEPDETGNVTLVIPDPDLSELATKAELQEHEIKVASATVLGHVKVGQNLSVGEDGKLNASSGTTPDASLTVKGIVQLNNTLASTLTTQAATANAVKMVNDKLISPAVVLGSLANVQEATTGIAIGDNSKTTGTNGPTAIGLSANASNTSALAVGRATVSSGVGSVALGYGATAINNLEGVLGGTSGATSAWRVPGAFSVSGTKNFEMPHPNPDKKETHVIRHGAVESPTAGDTLYRYTMNALVDGESVELQLPDYFEYLNKDVDVYVNADKHFAHAFGEVVGDILKVTCEKKGSYKVLVIGTRNDDHQSVQNWDIKGVEREIGESWVGETYVFEDDEILTENEYLEATV